MDTLTRLLLLCACGLVGGLVGGEPLGRLLQRRRDAFEVYARQFTRQYEPYMFAAIPLHEPVPVLRVLSRAPLRAAPRPEPHAAASAPHAHYASPYSTLDHARLYPQPQASHHAPRYDQPVRYEPLRYEQSVRYERPARYEQSARYEQPARYEESGAYYGKLARPYPTPEGEYEAAAYDYRREYSAPRPTRPPTSYQKPRRQVAPALEYAAEYDPYAPQPHPSPLPQLTYALAPYDAATYPASPEPAPTVLYARQSPSGGYTYRRVPDEPAPAKKRAPVKEKEKIPFIVKIHKYRIVKDDLI